MIPSDSVRLVSTILATALMVGVAFAEDVPLAREHFHRGKVAFQLGHYLEAAKEYEAAYEAKDYPELLYNLGQAYRLAGSSANALRAYKLFLSRIPETPKRMLVERWIETLQSAVAEEGPVHPVPSPAVGDQATAGSSVPLAGPEFPLGSSGPTETRERSAESAPARASETLPARLVDPDVLRTATPDSAARSALPPTEDRKAGARRKWMRVAGVTVAAVGFAAIGSGAVCSVLAKEDSDALDRIRATGGVFDPSLERAGIARQIAADTLYAVGGAALVTGAILLVVGSRGKRAANATSVRLIPPTGSASGVALRIAF